MSPETQSQTLHAPRILCLHGGGTNDRIFRAQCRALEAQLKSTFRLCYAEAPFPSEAGPDVLSVYKDWGPFKRWIRAQPGQSGVDATTTSVEEIEECLHAAMDADDAKGATGEWIGLLGFSQGAKVCASLLLRQQLRAQQLDQYYSPRSDFRFAVVLAGSAPINPELLLMTPGLATISDPMSCVSADPVEEMNEPHHLLRLPTIHVHGMRDPGLKWHRKLLEYCSEESARLIEWDGEHRVPIKTKDVSLVVAEIFRVARDTGLCIDGA